MKFFSMLKLFWSLKCPKCHRGRLFKKYTLQKNCSECGFVFQSGAEGWAGPAFINYIITLLVVVIAVACGLIFFGLDNFVLVAISAVLLGALCNVMFYRYAHSFWLYFLHFFNIADEVHHNQ